MSKVKKKCDHPKLSAKDDDSRCSSDQYPWISFRYMTRNKDYSLDALDKMHGTNRETTLLCLHNKLQEISSNPWTYWSQLRKKSGLESIQYDRLRFKANEEAPLTSDATVYVFRFDTHLGTGTGRIIGFKDSPCATLHIIGYDFDFSAYDHG